MVFARAGQENFFHSTHLPQPVGPLPSAAAAGVEERGHLIKIERMRCGKKKAVDLSGRARQRKCIGPADEESDGLSLEGIQ